MPVYVKVVRQKTVLQKFYLKLCLQFARPKKYFQGGDIGLLPRPS